MTALSLESAKNIAIVVAIGLVALCRDLGLVIKNVTTKLITGRADRRTRARRVDPATSLQDCADKRQGIDGALGDTTDVTCTFFGTDVDVAADAAVRADAHVAPRRADRQQQRVDPAVRQKRPGG